MEAVEQWTYAEREGNKAGGPEEHPSRCRRCVTVAMCSHGDDQAGDGDGGRRGEKAGEPLRTYDGTEDGKQDDEASAGEGLQYDDEIIRQCFGGTPPAPCR